jgi:peptidylprolyl isomerase
MAAKKNTRAKQRRPSARAAAAARARRRASRRRLFITGSSLAVVLAIVALMLGPVFGSKSSPDTSTSTSSASTTSPTTVAPLPSVKGKPCVAVVGPLPKGAPAVPVELGPPPTALVKKDLTAGTGAVVAAGATLTVDYIGVACSTGKIFDSSYSRGQPASFGLDQVIAGWKDGLPGMKVGGTRLLGIPSKEAYGSAGRAPDIAPDEMLWFVVHVISAK